MLSLAWSFEIQLSKAGRNVACLLQLGYVVLLLQSGHELYEIQKKNESSHQFSALLLLLLVMNSIQFNLRV